MIKLNNKIHDTTKAVSARYKKAEKTRNDNKKNIVTAKDCNTTDGITEDNTDMKANADTPTRSGESVDGNSVAKSVSKTKKIHRSSNNNNNNNQ